MNQAVLVFFSQLEHMSIRVVQKAFGVCGSLRSLSSTRVCLQAKNGEVVASGRPQVPQNLKNSTRNQVLPIQPRLPYLQLNNPQLERTRVVPTLATFYGGNPRHDDTIDALQALVRKYINLPTRVIDESEYKTSRFISFEDYSKLMESGTRLKIAHYKEFVLLLNRLRSIDTQLVPRDVSETLQKYTVRAGEASVAANAVKTLDSWGRALGNAKRKRSSATVHIVRGDGQVIVNGVPLTNYFARETDRRKIAYPFQVVGQEAQYNVFARTSGGGVSGQVEAVMYAISKALIVFNPLLKPRLHKAGLLTSDTRKVERKKPGKVKARKSPTWVKR